MAARWLWIVASLLAGAVVVAAVAIWTDREPAPANDATANATADASSQKGGRVAPASRGDAGTSHAAGGTGSGSAPVVADGDPSAAGSGLPLQSPRGDRTVSSVVRWPVTAAGPTTAAAPVPTPAVAEDLAFRALRLVGVDAQAERTWQRAIDDPATPADVRSDLIEDLNQAGYTDDSHPGEADLPLVDARMALIERLAPHARDRVNAAAFEEAYKDLLEMYVRLSGAPTSKR